MEFCTSCVWRERERQGHITVELSCLNHGLCANTYKHHHWCLSRDSVPSQAWTDGKTKDIINCLYIYFERWSLLLWKGALHFSYIFLVVFGQSQCTVPVWPIRADCTCRKEGLCRKTTRLREAGHRWPTIMYSIWKIMCFLNIKACQHISVTQNQIHKIMIFKKASYDPFKVNIYLLIHENMLNV